MRLYTTLVYTVHLWQDVLRLEMIQCFVLVPVAFRDAEITAI